MAGGRLAHNQLSSITLLYPTPNHTLALFVARRNTGAIHCYATAGWTILLTVPPSINRYRPNDDDYLCMTYNGGVIDADNEDEGVVRV